jgi:lipopolysaccharide export system protein LptA
MQNPTKTLRATAAIGMALVSPPLHASPPTALKQAEVTALHAEANTKSPVAATAMAAAHANLNADLIDSAAATQAANSFITVHQVPPIGASTPSVAKPLEVHPSLNDTVIQCEGGVYFDAEAGVLVYLKNVTVKDPRFDLSGADELKIFFEKKPAQPKGKPNTEAIQPGADAKPKAAKSSQATLGNPDRIVATGAVRIDQKSTEGKEPIKASGAIFRYNIKSDEAILSGGYPWFIQGTTFMRAKEPNLILRIFPKTGSFVTEGNWEMGGNIQEKR